MFCLVKKLVIRGSDSFEGDIFGIRVITISKTSLLVATLRVDCVPGDRSFRVLCIGEMSGLIKVLVIEALSGSSRGFVLIELRRA